MTSRPGGTSTPEVVPPFVRVEVSDEPEIREIPVSHLCPASASPVLAAELIDAGTGRRLRIFNGADQSTVQALLSTLSTLR